MTQFLVLLLAVLLAAPLQEVPKQSLCRKWQQVGLKAFGHPYKSIEGCMAERIEFRDDATFSKTLYCTLDFGGKWKFNDDSSRIAIALTEQSGRTIPKAMGIESSKPTTIILLLSTDSLVLGEEAYFGPERKLGHDDKYYVPIKD